MHLPIRDGIQKAKTELGVLWYDIEDIVCYLDSFKYLMRGLMVQKMMEVRPQKKKDLRTRVAKPSPSRLRGPHRTPANGRESWQRARRCLQRRSRQRRGRESLTKKRSGWRSLTGRTFEIRRRRKRRSYPQRRKNLAVRAQKWCSLNQQREWATLLSYANSRSASTLTNWAPQFKELGRRAPRICWWNWNVHHKKQKEDRQCLERGGWSQEDGPTSNPQDLGRDRRPGTNHWSGRRWGCRQELLRPRNGAGAKGVFKQDTL